MIFTLLSHSCVHVGSQSTEIEGKKLRERNLPQVWNNEKILPGTLKLIIYSSSPNCGGLVSYDRLFLVDPQS